MSKLNTSKLMKKLKLSDMVPNGTDDYYTIVEAAKKAGLTLPNAVVWELINSVKVNTEYSNLSEFY